MLNDLLAFKRIKDGDIKAFEHVFRQYYAPLCMYSYSITGQQEASEEVVQELFYVLWRDRQELRILRSIKSYLYGAIRNQSLQYIEHKNIQNRYKEKALYQHKATHDETPHEQMEYRELEKIIDQALKRLPERRLKIFRMHRNDGKKYKEIAEILSLSVKTVEAEMTKTYQALRLEIEKYTHTS
ncbi:RNA polymerase sigma-70 factor (ECF subfamily) [Dysgonomonas hofstadii]|uniref:RNA polymerase sigma-70 factor (ECF subfamily) n=1 Tax=Dysgonomonas hofstadii TaxID=637886 RepID=A0A840CGN5_9BACT|nr:RNA polymerase sigma-70 factor [Dysgonomonas hofstadii]MBB4035120.1 RNA polymerase sigma-70 factor (ECF subfamily) [Dysgonomonas hofstadii]